MADLLVTEWKRYGHHRAYVADADGTRLGFLDRKSGELHVDDQSRRAEVVQALGLIDDTEFATAVAVSPPLEPASPAPEPWAITLAGDYGVNKAGTGAREMARLEREAAPVRTALARILRVHTDERAWRQGALGEERVGRELAKLPDGWVVLHDLPIGTCDANIDHLVIGPGGVFTLNAKMLTGRVWVRADAFWVNGQRTPYIRISRFEGERVRRILSAVVGEAVPVLGCIVPMCDDFTMKEAPADVAVVLRRQLVRWLLQRPVVLTPDQVSRLERVARTPSTWAPSS